MIGKNLQIYQFSSLQLPNWGHTTPGITQPKDRTTGVIDTKIFLNKFVEKLNNDRKLKRAAVKMPKRKYGKIKILLHYIFFLTFPAGF